MRKKSAVARDFPPGAGEISPSSPRDEEFGLSEEYSIVIICTGCKDGHDAGNPSGTRMQAVSGAYTAAGGFIFQSPRCGRKVAVAYVPARFSKKIQVIQATKKRKLKNSEFLQK